MRRLPVSAALCLLLAAPALRAGEVARLRKLAERMVARDRTGAAVRYLAEALALAPASEAVLKDLLTLRNGDRDESALWAHFLAERVTDARGRFARPVGWPAEIWRPLEPALQVARVRAATVERLVVEAKKLRKPTDTRYARLLRDVAREVMTPALRRKHGAFFEQTLERCQPDHAAVLGKLERAMIKTGSLRAALILRGACVQARRSKLGVRRLQAMETAAARMIRKLRKTIGTEPLTIADLEAIPKEERPEWERGHGDWTNPTVVLSPGKRYRIESTCGVRTTLMAAADVEYQHARLVAWFGQDPFLDAQGTIRLCRTPAGLEGEGQPHYWAPGFQSGHTTTMVVNASNRQGIASTLTHELTHRFDGAIYPLMPAWIVEGRAVYTAGGTLWPRSEKVEPRAMGFGSLYRASVLGYGARRNLVKLLEGTIDDYRDNYPVGFSMWVYLTRYRKERYGARVEPFLRSFKMKRGLRPVDRFERYFGKLDEFVKGWRRYLSEGAALDPVAWKKEWQALSRAARNEASARQRELAKGARGELASPWDRDIFDHSNWPRYRGRHDDPAFGERHAYAAGLWFDEHKMTAAAREAFAWALHVDELEADQLARITPLLPAPKRPVHLLRALLDRLQASARGPRSARAMRAEQARLSGEPARDDTKVGNGQLSVPDCGPFVGLLEAGIVEEWWAPGDTELRKNWHIDGGSLVLGARKPLETISGYKRDAYVKKVFVRGQQWFSGTYTFRVRVRLPGAHLSAGVVLGHTRHDRGLRIGLGGGDWAYAVGRKKEAAGFRSIGVSIGDLRSWDGGVGRLRARVAFKRPQTSFLLEARVSGSFLRVFIDGEAVLSHRTTSGLPIEGRIGFHVGSGLADFSNPAVARHRVLGDWRTCPCEHHDQPVDLAARCTIPWETLPGRRLLGLPKDPLGTVLLCHVQDLERAREIWTRIAGNVARVSITDAPLESIKAYYDAWYAAERKRRKKGLEKFQADAPARPPWLAVNRHGIIVARGIWVEPWWGGFHKTLVRRLRGW